MVISCDKQGITRAYIFGLPIKYCDEHNEVLFEKVIRVKNLKLKAGGT